MNCPRCGTAFSPPTTSHEPRLYCRHCGARLFAWLGDHFGVRDAVATPPARQTGNANMGVTLILIFVFVVIALYSCACLSAFLR
jgi:hypothetical protein